MSKECSCGGRFVRSDIRAVYSLVYKRIMYEDTDPIKANWKCSKCGDVRTQKKRQSKKVPVYE